MVHTERWGKAPTQMPWEFVLSAANTHPAPHLQCQQVQHGAHGALPAALPLPVEHRQGLLGPELHTAGREEGQAQRGSNCITLRH